ncbi:MAG: 4Fe-4S dicluster domain-containing protein [Methanomassiliicoccales archaeon]
MDNPQEGIPRLAREAAVRYARVPGVFMFVRWDRCRGCGICVKDGFCRFGAISIVDRKATVDERRCRGCARCTHLCPREALAIEVRPPKMVRGALEHLDRKVSKILK